MAQERISCCQARRSPRTRLGRISCWKECLWFLRAAAARKRSTRPSMPDPVLTPTPPRSSPSVCSNEQPGDAVRRARSWTLQRHEWPTAFVLSELMRQVGPLVLAGKSPTTALHPARLQRVPHRFPHGRFIHLAQEVRTQRRRSSDRSGVPIAPRRPVAEDTGRRRRHRGDAAPGVLAVWMRWTSKPFGTIPRFRSTRTSALACLDRR